MMKKKTTSTQRRKTLVLNVLKFLYGADVCGVVGKIQLPGVMVVIKVLSKSYLTEITKAIEYSKWQ